MQMFPNIVKISTHLQAEKVEDFSVCPVCGCREARRTVGTVQSDPEIRLLKCPLCHAVSASHLPCQEYLAEYYGDSFARFYGLYNETEKCDITFSAPGRFVKHIARVIPFDSFGNHSSVHILDFGGGDGTLGLLVAREIPEGIPVKVTIVDYGENIVDEGVERIEVRKEENLDSIREAADIVLASASLEHVPHVEPVIRKLLSLLLPGGLFYARTPYIMPIKRIFKSIDFGYPVHVHDMGADFWNSFLDVFELEFSIIESRPSIVQLTFAVDPLRCAVAHLLKLPARIECALFPRKKFLLWPFAGGWEVLLEKTK